LKLKFGRELMFTLGIALRILCLR